MMARHPLMLLACAACTFVLWTQRASGPDSSTAPTSAPASAPEGYMPVSFVFKGDLRRPDQIRRAGGFFPPPTTTTASGKLKRDLSNHELEQQSSLFYHHTGATAKYTRYVSTTEDPKVAMRHAQLFRGHGRGKAAFGEEEIFGYIYRISADAKMVDVVASLGQENMLPEYVEQAEHAVVSGVPYEQIEGWYHVRDLGIGQLKSLREGHIIEDLFVRNPEFDEKYRAHGGSGAQPQLAGFGKRTSIGLEAGQRDPWRRYQTVRVQDALDQFQKRVAPHLVPVRSHDEELGFSEADALGARDLFGALDLGELEEGITAVEGPQTATPLGQSNKQKSLGSSKIFAGAAEDVQIGEILRSQTRTLLDLTQRSVAEQVRHWLVILK